MAQEMIHVSAEEFAHDLNGFLARIVQEREPIVVEVAPGASVEMRPVRPARPPRRRPRTAADHEAFLSAAGSWSDEDGEVLLRWVQESRSLPPRPLPEL